MVTTLEQPISYKPSKLAVIDCDIHPAPKSPKALHPYLSERWRQHRDTIGDRGFDGAYYPRANPNAARTDVYCICHNVRKRNFRLCTGYGQLK